MQLLIFIFTCQQTSFWAHSKPFFLTSFEVGGLKWTFGIWLLRNQVAAPFAPIPCGIWWAQMDSDHRPHAYQACALTS